MEDRAKTAAETELFDEEALLALMDGNRDDAKAILATGVAEMREMAGRLELSARTNDFAGILLHASNAQGVAGAMCSSMLGGSAQRVARMAFIRNSDEAKRSILELQGALKLLELRLRRDGWL